ncbi:MAG: hypothetical protein ABRQ37_06370 [Candidatus Eremiobacterota bacterium]
MDLQESFKITYQVMSLIKHLFIIVPVVIVLTSILSMFNFKHKKLKEMFNDKDVTTGLTTLFPLLVISIIALFFCLARVVDYLKKSGVKFKYYPLLSKVVLPICQVKAPVVSVIMNELAGSAPFTIPLLLLTVIGIIVKWKDAASKALIITASLDLFLILIVYKLYMIYYVLFGIRIAH